MSKNEITGDNITSKPSNTYANNFGNLKICRDCGLKSHYKDKFVVGAEPAICNDCYMNLIQSKINCENCD